jgi:uncharacterized protein with von Willebrand factor type A (vWA) domain
MSTQRNLPGRRVDGRAAGRSVLLDPLLRLAASLRDVGVPVSSSELIDASLALGLLNVADRAIVRQGIAATIVKRADDLPTFNALFEDHFPIRRWRPSSGPEPAESDGLATGPGQIETSLDRPEGEGQEAPDLDLLEALLDALRRNDLDALRDLAGLAVGRFGGLETQVGATERYYLYRVLRALDLSRLMLRALLADRSDDAAAGLDDAARRVELSERIEAFKRMLAGEIRIHLGVLKGADDVARTLGSNAIEETDFLGASPRQLAAMRAVIRPLARVLAAKMARRRRRRDQGRLDVRRTVRRSLSSGGVLLDPVFRRPRIARPDLYLVCDVSGSVAEFASFTLTLLQALIGEFARMRSFAFVDGVAEVTDHLKDVASFLEVSHVLYRADVVRGDGHSDYGAVFDQFWTEIGPSIDGRSTVIVTGDLRSNYRDPRVQALKALHARARRVYLLNPEPVEDWDTTDSIVAAYAHLVDGIFEVRNLRQLAEAVLQIT